MRKRARQAGGVSPDTADAEVMVRRSSIVACITCGLCGRRLRNATAISECLHAFCRKCIVDEFNHKDTRDCPKCGIDLGCDPLEKLRPDHNLECIGLVIFSSKRCKFEEISLQPALGDHSEAENLILREELENERARKTAAFEKSTILEVARLEEELENAKLEKSTASERARVLEEKLQDHTEWSQDTEAAQRELLQETSQPPDLPSRGFVFDLEEPEFDMEFSSRPPSPAPALVPAEDDNAFFYLGSPTATGASVQAEENPSSAPATENVVGAELGTETVSGAPSSVNNPPTAATTPVIPEPQTAPDATPDEQGQGGGETEQTAAETLEPTAENRINTEHEETPAASVDIASSSRAMQVEEEILEIHQESQIGGAIDPDEITGDFQMGFVERGPDGQPHNVTYSSAIDDENIRLLQHYADQTNEYIKAVIEDSQKKSACIRRMTSAHNKAARLESQLAEELKQREQDEKTIQSLQAQLAGLKSEKENWKTSMAKSRELYDNASKKIKTLEYDNTGLKNEVYRKENERQLLAEELEQEKKQRQDADAQTVQMLKHLNQLRESNAQLAVKMQDLIQMKANYEASKKSLEETTQRLEGLAMEIEDLKIFKIQLGIAQAYIKELEEAALPIVDTLFSEVYPAQATPILERLKQVPDHMKSFVRLATKVVINHLLAVIQSRWSIEEIEQVTDGVAEECTEEEYAALKNKSDPIAETLVNDLDM